MSAVWFDRAVRIWKCTALTVIAVVMTLTYYRMFMRPREFAVSVSGSISTDLSQGPLDTPLKVEVQR